MLRIRRVSLRMGPETVMLTYAITNQQPFLRTWRRDRYPDKSDTPELADFNVAPELENHHTDGR